jgi:transcriptional regulator with XRE-family HTH domain
VSDTPDTHEGIVFSDDSDGESLEVGVRLRELRTGRRLTLKVVAERAGISEGFLSQIELGRSAPSLKTLRRIAQALGLDVGDVLSDYGVELPQLIPRHAGRALEIGLLSKFRLTPHAVTSMEVLRGVFEIGGSAGEPYTHGESDEVFIVLSGSIRATVAGNVYDMGPGDSLCYRSSMLHTFDNVGDEKAVGVWLIAPPTY